MQQPSSGASDILRGDIDESTQPRSQSKGIAKNPAVDPTTIDPGDIANPDFPTLNAEKIAKQLIHNNSHFNSSNLASLPNKDLDVIFGYIANANISSQTVLEILSNIPPDDRLLLYSKISPHTLGDVKDQLGPHGQALFNKLLSEANPPPISPAR